MVASLTLREVRARPVLLSLRRPVVARIAKITDWPLVLVDLVTEEGVTGRAYLEPYVPRTMRYLVPMLEDLGTLLRGRAVRPVELFEAARKSLHFVGYEGLAAIAVAGLDMAAWDAVARAHEVPLCVLLGGSIGEVEAYDSNGLWLDEPARVAAEAVELRDDGGCRGLKLRLGRADPLMDEAAIAAVRAAVGEDVALMVDYNQGLNYAEAVQRCPRLDGLGLAWIEEPLVYDDLEGHARLARDLTTPIMLGENFYGPRALHHALRLQACDLVMPDFMRIGGVTGWLRAAPIAAAAGIPVSTHLYPEVAAHVLRVTEGAHWLEWQSWAEPLPQEPYALREGRLVVPHRPGLGLDWDERAVAAHLVA